MKIADNSSGRYRSSVYALTVRVEGCHVTQSRTIAAHAELFE